MECNTSGTPGTLSSPSTMVKMMQERSLGSSKIKRKPYTHLACDYCKDKHLKCDGRKPSCFTCSSKIQECRYREERNRKRDASQLRAHKKIEDDLKIKILSLEKEVNIWRKRYIDLKLILEGTLPNFEYSDDSSPPITPTVTPPTPRHIRGGYYHPLAHSLNLSPSHQQPSQFSRPRSYSLPTPGLRNLSVSQTFTEPSIPTFGQINTQEQPTTMFNFVPQPMEDYTNNVNISQNRLFNIKNEFAHRPRSWSYGNGEQVEAPINSRRRTHSASMGFPNPNVHINDYFKELSLESEHIYSGHTIPVDIDGSFLQHGNYDTTGY